MDIDFYIINILLRDFIEIEIKFLEKGFKFMLML